MMSKSLEMVGNVPFEGGLVSTPRRIVRRIECTGQGRVAPLQQEERLFRVVSEPINYI
jgi:GTP cyclohydrolase I